MVRDTSPFSIPRFNFHPLNSENQWLIELSKILSFFNSVKHTSKKF
jgi:hypothetical protein